MDGTISVNSELNKGSTFTVKLCLEIHSDDLFSNVVPETDKSVKLENNFENLKVLIVEDNSTNRKLLFH